MVIFISTIIYDLLVECMLKYGGLIIFNTDLFCQQTTSLYLK